MAIDGVSVKKLILHKDFRGSVMELLRSDDSVFSRFGQVYMTSCNPGIAKAWHYHKNSREYFSCVNGVLNLVLYDDRDDSPTKGNLMEFSLSLENPILVAIPPYVWHGFECGTDEDVIGVNFKSEPYDPKNPDKVTIPFNDPKIPHKWKATRGG